MRKKTQAQTLEKKKNMLFDQIKQLKRKQHRDTGQQHSDDESFYAPPPSKGQTSRHLELSSVLFSTSQAPLLASKEETQLTPIQQMKKQIFDETVNLRDKENFFQSANLQENRQREEKAKTRAPKQITTVESEAVVSEENQPDMQYIQSQLDFAKRQWLLIHNKEEKQRQRVYDWQEDKKQTTLALANQYYQSKLVRYNEDRELVGAVVAFKQALKIR